MKTQTELHAEVELMILRERERQTTEGYDAQHDDRHRRGEIGVAAAVYFDCAMIPGRADGLVLNSQRTPGIKWPWDLKWFKPWQKADGPRVVDSERCLVKAGALLRAEQDRLARLERKVVASLQSVLFTKAHVDAIQLKPGARGLADS